MTSKIHLVNQIPLRSGLTSDVVWLFLSVQTLKLEIISFSFNFSQRAKQTLQLKWILLWKFVTSTADKLYVNKWHIFKICHMTQFDIEFPFLKKLNSNKCHKLYFFTMKLEKNYMKFVWIKTKMETQCQIGSFNMTDLQNVPFTTKQISSCIYKFHNKIQF